MPDERLERKKRMAATAEQRKFVKTAVVALRQEPYKGIHIVYSGFNQAFRMKFPEADVREVTAQMQADGEVRIIPCKGGAIMYLAEDGPASNALNKIEVLLKNG